MERIVSTGRAKESARARHEEVLEVIVTSYVDTAEPVGSRVVARKMELSSATIRNVMQDLEEDGLIAQPHTSAGRIPTEKGYRYYIDFLMPLKKLTESQMLSIDLEYRAKMRSLDDILEKTSHIMSKITRCAGVVLFPKTERSHFKHIDLVSLGKNRVLVILIMESGIAKDLIISLDYPVDDPALERIAVFLNNVLRGMTLEQAKEYLARKLRDERDSSYRLIEEAKNIISGILISQLESRLYIDGTSHIFAQPEFNDSKRIASVMEFLEEKRSLSEIISGDADDTATKVLIGHESRTRDLSDLSVVTSGYRIDDALIGRLGVIGPTRMNYERVVPLVGFLAQTLTRLLSEER